MSYEQEFSKSESISQSRKFIKNLDEIIRLGEIYKQRRRTDSTEHKNNLTEKEEDIEAILTLLAEVKLLEQQIMQAKTILKKVQNPLKRARIYSLSMDFAIRLESFKEKWGENFFQALKS